MSSRSKASKASSSCANHPADFGPITYRGVIPLRQIPALVDGDLTIIESEVISEYLEERFPEPRLLPDELQARAHSRFFSRFHDIHLEPPIRNIYYQVPESTRDMSVVDENLARIQVLLDRFGSIAQPAPFLIGDRIRLADCAYPSTLMYLELVTEAMGLRRFLSRQHCRMA